MTALPARSPSGTTLLAAGEHAIARSVVFASIFDYPLTLAQLRQTLIESEQTPTEILAAYERSAALRSVVEYRDGFFFPRGRRDLVDERRRREAGSRAFLRRHQMFLRLVCSLPFVRLVALSGSIAHLNLDRAGDLDLFIITRGARVWSISVVVVLLAKLVRCRRTVCANYVLADTHLALDQEDLFTASQVIHLKPLVGRDVLLDFVAANPFVKRFYPNFHHAEPLMLLDRNASEGDPPDGNSYKGDPASAGLAGRSGGAPLIRLKPVLEWLLTLPSLAFEAICRRTYRAYLQRQSSSWHSPDQVRLDDQVLKLHTRSHRQAVMERFRDSLQKLEVGGKNF
jgi:hypothetical protein